MHKLTRLAATAVAAAALVAPAVSSTATAAPAATGQTTATSERQLTTLAERKGKGGIKVKTSKDGYHAGGTAPFTATATVKGVKKGKVSFTVGSVKGKAKLKKGKATWAVPLTLAPGAYNVTAKLGKRKGKAAFSVWSSKLIITQPSITVSKAAISNPDFTGTVEWKGAPASTGYVDFYQDGNAAGGSASPFLAGFGSIQPGGAFTMRGSTFESYFTKKALPYGNYTFQAYYTADAGYDDYIYSTPVTVVWAP